ncbi:MAG TPA: PepSY domain-containing protein [Novosphingobium sp.]
MKRLAVPLALGAAALVALVQPAPLAIAAPGDEQGQVRKDMRAGAVRPLREIEGKVLPMMTGMQYLGPEYDPTAMAYRLKFIRDGRVVFVDVDARSGQILGRH